MLRIHKILTLSISGLLLAGMAMTAHAQVETLPTQSISDPTDLSGSFLFTKFNPSLGTLNQVDIVLTDSLGTQITVTNSSLSSSSGNVFTRLQSVLYDPSTTITTPGSVITPVGGLFNLTDGATTNLQIYSLAAGGSSTLAHKTASNSNDSSPGFTDTGTLTFFTGATGSATVDYQTLTNTDLSNTGGNTTSSQSSTDTLTATVTYFYTPASETTPEPGTWAMMVAGASTGLIALRRRRRNKK